MTRPPSPTPSGPATPPAAVPPPAPPLPFDAILPILTTAIRMLKPHGSTDLTHVTSVLNVLPRSDVPELSHLTITLAPWIDTNHACKVGSTWLLDTLHFHLSKPPYSRPVAFAHTIALANASRFGHVHVLEWWAEHMNMRRVDAADYLALATKYEQPEVMNWWVSGKLPGVAFDQFEMHPINEATSVEMLDWHVAHFGSDLDAKKHWIGNSFVRAVRRLVGQGQEQVRAVVEWWMGPAAAELQLPKCYYEEAKVAVIVEHGQRRHDLQATIGLLTQLRALWKSAKAKARCQRFDAFATLACHTGDLQLVEWCMENLGKKIHASWAVALASGGGHIHVLDWLQAQGHRFTGFAGKDRYYHPSDSEDDDIGYAFVYLPHNMFEACSKCRFSDFKGHYWSVWNDLYPGDLTVKWMKEPLSPIEMASARGQVKVLDWMFQKYRGAFKSKQISLLNFSWTLAERSVALAAAHGHVNVMEWWYDGRHSIPDRHNVNATHNATSRGQMPALEFLAERGLIHPLASAFLEEVVQDLVRAIVFDNANDIGRQKKMAEWWYKWALYTPKCPTDLFLRELWTKASQTASVELLNHLWDTCGFRPRSLDKEALNHFWGFVARSDWMLRDKDWQVRTFIETGRIYDNLYWWMKHAPELLAKLDFSTQKQKFPMLSGHVLYLDEWFKLGLLPAGFAMPISFCTSVAGLDWAVQHGRVRLAGSKDAVVDALALAARRRAWEAVDWWKTCTLECAAGV